MRTLNCWKFLQSFILSFIVSLFSHKVKKNLYERCTYLCKNNLMVQNKNIPDLGPACWSEAFSNSNGAQSFLLMFDFKPCCNGLVKHAVQQYISKVCKVTFMSKNFVLLHILLHIFCLLFSALCLCLTIVVFQHMSI